MPTKHLKLLLILIAGAFLFACAHRAPLQLPPPMIADGADSGWRNY